MSLIFRRDSGSPFPEPIVPPWPGAFSNGIVRSDAALQVDAVWACVRLLSDTVAMLPLIPMQVRGGIESPLPREKWPSLLVEPYGDISMADWLRQMMFSLLLRGNAYAEWGGDPNRGGTLLPLSPDRVQATLDASGKKIIKVDGVARPNIMHIARWVLPGEVQGISPIRYASTMIQTQLLVEDFARSYFTDAPHPSHVFTSDHPINQEQARTIKDRIMASAGSREPLVIGLGLKHESLSVTPEESQFLQTKQYGVSGIARIFGVPAEMIGGGVSGQNVTYANVTQRALDFLTFGVQPWLTVFENAISRVLPGRKTVRFDTRELIRMTPMDQATVNKLDLSTGERTINEARRPQGLPDVPWGDEPYLPGMSPAAAGAVATEPKTGEGE